MAANKLRIAILLATAAAVATGCANRRDQQLAYVERPAEVIYNEAYDQIERQRFREAQQLFDEVERQHPYSEWARRAIMMAAFAAYERGDYDGAIQASERYIALYPSGQTTAYAYYLVAISYYEQILDVGRDQRITQQALAALEQVVRRYPNSEYARDARLKIDLTRDHLAGKEMDIGRWYLRRGHHLAAINRFRRVVDEYQTTSHVPEAMHRLVEAYVSIGILEEARQVASVLGYNYPGSNWYSDSYNLLSREGVVVAATGEAQEPEQQRRSWWGRTVGRLF